MYVTRISRYITLHHVICSVRYYPRFHVTAVGLGTYYLWIWGSACVSVHKKQRIGVRLQSIMELLESAVSV